MNKTIIPTRAASTTEAHFTQTLITVTGNLSLMLRKLEDYKHKPHAALFEVSSEIKKLTALYSGNIQTRDTIERWIASQALPVTLISTAQLCLSQVALMQSSIQKGLELLRSRLDSAPNLPRVIPVVSSLDHLPRFLAFLEEDRPHEVRRYTELEALASLDAPPLTELDVVKIEDSVDQGRSVLDASRNLVKHWEKESLSPSQVIFLESVRQAIADYITVLNDIAALIPVLRVKTIEARSAAASSALLPPENKN